MANIPEQTQVNFLRAAVLHTCDGIIQDQLSAEPLEQLVSELRSLLGEIDSEITGQNSALLEGQGILSGKVASMLAAYGGSGLAYKRQPDAQPSDRAIALDLHRFREATSDVTTTLTGIWRHYTTTIAGTLHKTRHAAMLCQGLGIRTFVYFGEAASLSGRISSRPAHYILAALCPDYQTAPKTQVIDFAHTQGRAVDRAWREASGKIGIIGHRLAMLEQQFRRIMLNSEDKVIKHCTDEKRRIGSMTKHSVGSTVALIAGRSLTEMARGQIEEARNTLARPLTSDNNGRILASLAGPDGSMTNQTYQLLAPLAEAVSNGEVADSDWTSEQAVYIKKLVQSGIGRANLIDAAWRYSNLEVLPATTEAEARRRCLEDGLTMYHEAEQLLNIGGHPTGTYDKSIRAFMASVSQEIGSTGHLIATSLGKKRRNSRYIPRARWK